MKIKRRTIIAIVIIVAGIIAVASLSGIGLDDFTRGGDTGVSVTVLLNGDSGETYAAEVDLDQTGSLTVFKDKVSFSPLTTIDTTVPLQPDGVYRVGFLIDVQATVPEGFDGWLQGTSTIDGRPFYRVTGDGNWADASVVTADFDNNHRATFEHSMANDYQIFTKILDGEAFRDIKGSDLDGAAFDIDITSYSLSDSTTFGSMDATIKIIADYNGNVELEITSVSGWSG